MDKLKRAQIGHEIAWVPLGEIEVRRRPTVARMRDHVVQLVLADVERPTEVVEVITAWCEEHDVQLSLNKRMKLARAVTAAVKRAHDQHGLTGMLWRRTMDFLRGKR
jgi:hypothetical protein